MAFAKISRFFFREISLCFRIFRFCHFNEKMRNFAKKFAKYELKFFSRNVSFAANPRRAACQKILKLNFWIILSDPPFKDIYWHASYPTVPLKALFDRDQECMKDLYFLL